MFLGQISVDLLIQLRKTYKKKKKKPKTAIKQKYCHLVKINWNYCFFLVSWSSFFHVCIRIGSKLYTNSIAKRLIIISYMHVKYMRCFNVNKNLEIKLQILLIM